MASMFPGLAGGPSAGVVPMDLPGASDADLEAELAALIAQDNPSPQRPKPPAPPPAAALIPAVPAAAAAAAAKDERAAAKAALPGLDLDAIQRLLDEDPTQLEEPSPEDDNLLAELDALHGADAGSSPKKTPAPLASSPQRGAPSASSSSPSHSPSSAASTTSVVTELEAR